MAGFGYFVWTQTNDPLLRWYSGYGRVFWGLAIVASFFLAWQFDSKIEPCDPSFVRTIRFVSAVFCGSCWLVLLPLLLVAVLHWPYATFMGIYQDAINTQRLEYGPGVSRTLGWELVGLICAAIAGLVALGLNVFAVFSGTIPYSLSRYFIKREIYRKAAPFVNAALLGTWTVVLHEEGGKPILDEQGKKWTFFPTRVVCGDGTKWSYVTITDKSPNTMVIGKPRIYKVDQDTLTMCYRTDSGDPPKEFPVKPTANIALMILRRESKGKRS
jgi:uncharacterized protein (TIGR03067 family)